MRALAKEGRLRAKVPSPVTIVSDLFYMEFLLNCSNGHQRENR